MKKGAKWVIFLGIALIFLLHPKVALADRSYEITNYDAVARIKTDGTIDFTQHIAYSFDGDFNGVFYDQSLKKVTNISDVSVQITQDGRQIALQESFTGRNNTYQRTQTSDNMNLKVYHQISDGEFVVTYHYVLAGLITNYQDSAELNWKILGEGWDEPLSNVKVTVQFETSPLTQLQAWTHGPLTGKTEVDKQKGKVVLSVPELATNSMLETHMLFPTSVTPDNAKVSKEKIKASVQKLEATLAKKANEKRQAQARRDKLIGNVITGAVGILALGFIGLLVRDPGNKRQKFPPIKHSYELPTLSPLMASTVLKKAPPTSKELSVYLLELAGQNKIQITPFKKDYWIEVRDKTVLTEPLLKYLFTVVGDGKKFSLAELKRYGKRTEIAHRLNKEFTAWTKKVYKKAERLGYFDRQNKKWIWTIGLGGAVLLILLVSLGLMTKVSIGWGYLAFLGIVILALVTKYLWTHSFYTAKGQAKVYQLRCFKAMLRDVGRFDLREVGDIVLWEQILPYAVAFGLAKKVIKALKTQFTTADLEANLGAYYPLYFGGAWSRDFTTSFSTTFAGASSSAEGGSGGFSGGSSGGGGGGTGGAF